MSLSPTQLVEGILDFIAQNADGPTIKNLRNTLKNRLDELESEGDLINSIRKDVENQYQLSPGDLVDSFISKERHLTEPKAVWIIVSLHLFNNDRPKVIKHIQSGITKQKVYQVAKQWKNLNPKLKTDQSIITNVNQIIKTYEDALLQKRDAGEA